eukprot:SAG31_NODE_7454_length_1685_cov_2.784994_2_plen_119_part_00
MQSEVDTTSVQEVSLMVLANLIEVYPMDVVQCTGTLLPHLVALIGDKPPVSKDKNLQLTMQRWQEKCLRTVRAMSMLDGMEVNEEMNTYVQKLESGKLAEVWAATSLAANEPQPEPES